jgi:hypothetical protein
MRLLKALAIAGCALIIGATAAHAGINSKEVGALLIYPEYWATNPEEDPSVDRMDTYITITNDKSSFVRVHVEVIGAEACGDCNFDLTLTGFETTRLLFRREPLSTGGPYATVIRRASSTFGPGSILHSCDESHGFVVVSLESFSEPRRTLGENMLHGDEVMVNITTGTASQVGAFAVQGVGMNDGDRNFRFDNMEYAAFPSIVTTNFWSPNTVVEPTLVLFNVNFQTGTPPVTSCSLNYVDAFERMRSASFAFGCWTATPLLDIATGFHESVLGSANGFLWAQCGAGTHGALLTTVTGPVASYEYPVVADFKDTMFQSVTVNAQAHLRLTPSITSTP